MVDGISFDTLATIAPSTNSAVLLISLVVGVADVETHTPNDAVLYTALSRS